MTTPKVLLLGTSFSSIPLLEVLEKKKFEIHVMGANPQDPGHQRGHISVFQDYSSEKNVSNYVLQNEINFIVPSCNDYAYLSGSVVAHKFKLPGFDENLVTNNLHNKAKFRELCREINLSSPKFWTIDSQFINLESIKFPVIVKPTDSFSGIGVTKCANIEELKSAVEFAKENSRTGTLIIEEFISGTLHSISTFINNKRIIQSFFVDEFCTVHPYQVNSSNSPSRINLKLKSKLIKELSSFIRLNNLCDGLLHVQFIYNSDLYVIVEMMRRCPGDLYGTLIEKSTGQKYYENYIANFIGESVQFDQSVSKPKFFSRITINSPKVRFFSAIKFLNTKSVEFHPLKESEQILKEAPFDKAGIAFFEFKSSRKMYSITESLPEKGCEIV
jgi:hypothetical protein